MIRHSARIGRTPSTSSIQREVIQAHGHRGSNQNCTFSTASGCAVTPAATAAQVGLFPVPRVAQMAWTVMVTGPPLLVDALPEEFPYAWTVIVPLGDPAARSKL